MGKFNRLTVFVILASGSFTMIAGAIIAPALNQIREGFDATPASVGFIITTHSLFMTLSSPFIGSLIDRIGPKLVFKFLPDSSADLRRLTQIIQMYKGSMTPQGVLSLKMTASREAEFLDETIDVLKELSLI